LAACGKYSDDEPATKYQCESKHSANLLSYPIALAEKFRRHLAEMEIPLSK
jgi:hypothetical protein